MFGKHFKVIFKGQVTAPPLTSHFAVDKTREGVVMIMIILSSYTHPMFADGLDVELDGISFSFIVNPPKSL